MFQLAIGTVWFKYGLATCPKENDILVYTKDNWEQTDKVKICENIASLLIQNLESKMRYANYL